MNTISTTTTPRIDSKGKYYTKIVSTKRLKVVIRLTTGETVTGHIHVRPEKRLSDELNSDQPYISVTGAVLTRDSEILYETAFISLNRQAIMWVLPQQAIGEAEEDEEE